MLSGLLSPDEASTPAQLRASSQVWAQQARQTAGTSARRASSVSTTPMSQPCCSASSLSFSALTLSSSACNLAFSAKSLSLLAFSNCCFQATICSLAVTNCPLTSLASFLWLSAYVSALFKAELALFLSCSSAFNFYLRSALLFSAMVSVCTAAILLFLSSSSCCETEWYISSILKVL